MKKGHKPIPANCELVVIITWLMVCLSIINYVRGTLQVVFAYFASKNSQSQSSLDRHFASSVFPLFAQQSSSHKNVLQLKVTACRSDYMAMGLIGILFSFLFCTQPPSTNLDKLRSGLGLLSRQPSPSRPFDNDASK